MQSIINDQRSKQFKGIFYDSLQPPDEFADEYDKYLIIMNREIDHGHREIINYYGLKFAGVKVYLCMENGSADHIQVRFHDAALNNYAQINVDANGWQCI